MQVLLLNIQGAEMMAVSMFAILQLLTVFHSANPSIVQCFFSSTKTDCNILMQCNNDSRVIGMPNSLPITSNDSEREFEIYLCSSYYSTAMANFVNVQSVSITGRPDRGSQINCSSSQNQNGFKFINVSAITISNVILIQCYFPERIEEKDINSSIFIQGSTDISIGNVGVNKSSGIGMAIVDSNGCISVINCTFEENYAPKLINSGCGLFIKSTQSKAEYEINNCKFKRNNASTQSANENYFLKSGRYDVVDFVRGGGMNIYFKDNTSNINMTISDCRFIQNQARHGGALSLAFQTSAHDVDVRVTTSHFESNIAAKRGGAAIVGYIHNSSNIMKNNKVLFFQCNFSHNEALDGGGMYLYAAPNYYGKHTGDFVFQNCTWLGNMAKSGVALLILPFISKDFFQVQNGHLPTPVFENCFFSHNGHNKSENDTYLKLYEKEIKNDKKLIQYGKGMLFTSALNILIKGDTKFINNRKSAVYLLSSNLIVNSSSCLLFEKNHGYEGGAIHLDGFASIIVKDNVMIKFNSNYALHRGGAIYHGAVYELNHLMMQSNCFLKYDGTQTSNVSRRHINIEFKNNTIHNFTGVQEQKRGQTLFLFSAIPCSNIYDENNGTNFTHTLNQIAHVAFENGTESNTIGTYSSNISIHESLPIKVIPGVKKRLSIKVTDDMETEVKNPIIHIEVFGDGIIVDSSHVVVTNKKIKLLGRPESKGVVKLELFIQKDLSLQFGVILDYCPPGYVYDDKTKSCQCSINVERPFMGIPKCDLTSHRAVLVPGFWPGYSITDNNITNNFSYKNFRTSFCPIGYCNTAFSENETGYLLPKEPVNLNKDICSNNREGRVCAKRIANTSVFYHSVENFECREVKHCNIGIFLYIISEIVPVSMLFLIIILFDVQLTAGPLNGFLFYMQLLNTILLTRMNYKDIPVTKFLIDILHGIAKVFNLKFFVWPQMSFCLLKNMNSLHLLAFEYVTVVYSLVLTLLTILFMNLRCYKVRKMRRRMRGENFIFTKSIVHGLSGFLVLCYSRSTVTTLQILTPNRLYKEKEEPAEWAALYYGEYGYFDSNHSKYAIPALFVLTFMTCLPPLLLLIYPLCYKVLALIKLEESKFTKITCKLIPLEKFKPFFDSFQGTFKDNHRYFAGLYFTYRLLALIFQVATNTSTGYYNFLELQFFVMIIIHAWINPYKVNWHNKVELFFFSILILTNGITLYYYQELDTQYETSNVNKVLLTIQVILAYTPLLYIFVYGFYKLKIKLQDLRKKDDYNNELEMSLSTLAQDRLEQTAEISYHKID